MAKTIKMSLSTESINKAIKEIQAYQKEIERKTKIFAQRLAQEGVQVAKMQLLSFGFSDSSTGKLLSSISFKPGDVFGTDMASFYVYADCEYAIFVELGTGLTGEENPHKEANNLGWEYDSHEHGEDGWFYFKDGVLHWTRGLPARPFMFNTAQELKKVKVYAKIAKEVFSS